MIISSKSSAICPIFEIKYYIFQHNLYLLILNTVIDNYVLYFFLFKDNFLLFYTQIGYNTEYNFNQSFKYRYSCLHSAVLNHIVKDDNNNILLLNDPRQQRSLVCVCVGGGGLRLVE